jgi:hypothetical protein
MIETPDIAEILQNQIVAALKSQNVASEPFRRPQSASDDLLRMQDEIVARIANALHHPLIAAEANRAERSAEPASIELYFQGMAWVNKGQRPDWLDQAQSCFEKAWSIDDDNLEARVGLATVELCAASCAPPIIQQVPSNRPRGYSLIFFRQCRTMHGRIVLWLRCLFQRAAQSVA